MDTPTNTGLNHFVTQLQTDPLPMGRGRGYSSLMGPIGSLAIADELGVPQGGGALASLSAGEEGDSTSVIKVKVNFVPMKDLTSIAGIGRAYAKRMHSIRLEEGNLTPEVIKHHFGGRISEASLLQMDFEPNDMLDERKPRLPLPTMARKAILKQFDTDWAAQNKNCSKKSVKQEKDIAPTSAGKPTKKKSSLKQSPSSDVSSESEDEVVVKPSKKSALKKAKVKMDTDNSSLDESEDEEVIKSSRKKPHKKKKEVERDQSFLSESDSEEEQKMKHGRQKMTSSKKKSKPSKKVLESDDTESVSESEKVVKKKNKSCRKVRFETETEDDDDDDDVDHGPLRKMPRGYDRKLSYNGDNEGKGDDFQTFKFKFKSYAKAFKWTEEECRYCLCWSLTGEAARHHTLISSGQGPLTYKELMKCLEKRFGGKELIETAQARFNQACQEPRESLEVWADRVQRLALKAFRKLPESYATSQAVSRFCMGLEDKEASRDACLKRFKTIDEAKDYVHYFLHVASVNPKPKASRRTSSREHEEAVNVYETSINRIQAQFDERLKKMQSQFDKQMALNKQGYAGGRASSGRGIGGSYQESSGQEGYGRGGGYERRYGNQSQGGYGRSGGYRGRGAGGRPSRGRGERNDGWGSQQETGGRDPEVSVGINECFFCRKPGHIRADCREWLATQECFSCHEFGHRKAACPKRQAQRSSKDLQDLNRRGSGERAAPDS